MSKKTDLKKKIDKEKKNLRIKTILRAFLTVLLVIVGLSLVTSIIYGQIASKPSKVTFCVKSESDAQANLEKLPEVSKYLRNLKKQGQDPYVKIDMPMVTGMETKTGYAFVGSQEENNSKNVFAQYIFTTGCGSKFQKIKKSDYTDKTVRVRPLSFDYINKMAYKTYVDETKICIKDLTKTYRVDFDKDGEKEFLYGCVTGGNSNNVTYVIAKNFDGTIKELDTINSTGTFDEIADFNGDGYPDIALSRILMDEGSCKDAECYVPMSNNANEGKYLLKQSYHYLWNKDKNTFEPAVKAEVYYVKDGKKTVVKN